jgi:hypothetical protein
MIQYVKDLSRWDGDIIADELDAMRIRAKYAASQMATSLTGLAKGMWSRNASTDSLRPVGSSKTRSALVNKRLIRVTPEVTMNEPDRAISEAVGSPDGKCALVADTFNGRIFLFHVGAGLFTRLWKGYRGAQFRFLDSRTAVVVAPRQLFLELRDTVEDRRLAVVQLCEALPERTEFRLLAHNVLATSTPSGLEFHRLTVA